MLYGNRNRINNMDKTEILKALKQKVFYAELPSKMGMSVTGCTLYITIDADGVLQNMQNDASAFEGWVFCLRAFISEIKSVVIDWVNPTFSSEESVRRNQKKHYHRFLLRALWFVNNYSWATVVASKNAALMNFCHQFSRFILNYPLQKSKDKSEKSETDQKMKYEAMLETAIYQHLSKTGYANHQLPMGLFDGEVSMTAAMTPGGASQADLWKIEGSEFCVYELKDCINTDNTHVGIITELMFYANVLHRLLITQEIHYPFEADKFRTSKRDKASRGFEHVLDAIHQHSITHIKAVLLTDRLHPLIEYAKEQLLNDMNQCMANIKYEHSTVLQLMPAELIPAPSYKEAQGAQQVRALQTLPLFNGAQGGGKWKAGLQTIQLPFIIEEGKESVNLYPSIRQDAIDYFCRNGIGWWKSKATRNRPTGHMLSSQVSCVNHLFPFMRPEEAENLLLILNSIQDKFCFKRLLSNPLDHRDCNGNVCFEFVWKNRTLLGERTEKRGAMCTSIDAVIYAETADSQRVLIPIEWKYVEAYDHKRIAQASIIRYTSLIDSCSNIKGWNVAFEYDPLYELVRQTLLVEKIIKSDDATLPVDDYLHINVIPEGNVELRSEVSHYAEGLKDASKFIIMDPRQMMQPIKNTHQELYNYLETRYWK